MNKYLSTFLFFHIFVPTAIYMFFSEENPNWVLKIQKKEVHKNPKFRRLKIKECPRPWCDLTPLFWCHCNCHLFLCFACPTLLLLNGPIRACCRQMVSTVFCTNSCLLNHSYFSLPFSVLSPFKWMPLLMKLVKGVSMLFENHFLNERTRL